MTLPCFNIQARLDWYPGLPVVGKARFPNYFRYSQVLVDTRYFSSGPIRANELKISGLNGNITLCFMGVINISYFFVGGVRTVRVHGQ